MKLSDFKKFEFVQGETMFFLRRKNEHKGGPSDSAIDVFFTTKEPGSKQYFNTQSEAKEACNIIEAGFAAGPALFYIDRLKEAAERVIKYHGGGTHGFEQAIKSLWNVVAEIRNAELAAGIAVMIKRQPEPTPPAPFRKFPEGGFNVHGSPQTSNERVEALLKKSREQEREWLTPPFTRVGAASGFPHVGILGMLQADEEAVKRQREKVAAEKLQTELSSVVADLSINLNALTTILKKLESHV